MNIKPCSSILPMRLRPEAKSLYGLRHRHADNYLFVAILRLMSKQSKLDLNRRSCRLLKSPRWLGPVALDARRRQDSAGLSCRRQSDVFTWKARSYTVASLSLAMPSKRSFEHLFSPEWVL
ncbi:hypothetical protein BIW11_11548 [Tropilaelaps mercedesae]|uniref:Uncharacterized protein n=1 Tax=Tropilaelaps mercedesae TaxID=418985 RepID=A0A1V9XAK2_9ACAR|nr:hypothetical protein BIW11_11548 [Tropilaelaps mercedesae]